MEALLRCKSRKMNGLYIFTTVLKEVTTMRSKINVEQMELLLNKASFELGHFELRMFVYALSYGGSIVLSKKTMCKITDTGINNVNKQLSKLDFKGMAELDLFEGTVYTLNISLDGGSTDEN